MEPLHQKQHWHSREDRTKRICFVLNYHHLKTNVTGRVCWCGWQTLDRRRLQHQLVFSYKIKHGLQNISLQPYCIVPRTRAWNNNPDISVQIQSRVHAYMYINSTRVDITAWNLNIINKTPVNAFFCAGCEHSLSCSICPPSCAHASIYAFMHTCILACIHAFLYEIKITQYVCSVLFS